MLLTLVSCVKGKVTRTEECTINGVKVACSSLKVKSATAKVKTAVNIDYEKGEIEFLENAENEVELSGRNGVSRQCSITVSSGQTFKFQKDGIKLTLTDDGQSFTYKRVSAGPSGINGTWTALVGDEDFLIETTMEILNDSQVVLKALCTI